MNRLRSEVPAVLVLVVTFDAADVLSDADVGFIVVIVSPYYGYARKFTRRLCLSSSDF